MEIEELVEFLKQQGVGLGSVLVFEAGGLKTPEKTFVLDLVAALQQLVGSGGLLVVPTCTPPKGIPQPTFDPAHTPSDSGMFSEQFRVLLGVVRSRSPTHSVAARGMGAEEMLVGHRSAYGRQTPWGEGAFGIGSPWDHLYAANAVWVIINPDWTESPFTAYLLARYWERLQGSTKTTPFPEFEPALFTQQIEWTGLVQNGQWGQYQVAVFHTQTLINAVMKKLESDPLPFGPTGTFSDWLALRAEILEHGYIQAGVSRVSITPPVPFLRWEGRTVTGVFRPLYARAIVFSDGARQAALVVCDLIGMTRDLVQRIRAQVQVETGLVPENVLIACTHSHSTPDTIAAGFGDPAYLDFLVSAVGGAVRQAAAALQPVRIGWQRANIRGLARSRRQKLIDGRVFTTRYGVPSTWKVNPALVVGEGAIDPDLTVIRVEGLDGEVLAVISNFGCHPSVALTSPNISGDFPGEAMAILEGILSEHVVALATTGAAADVDPTLEMPYWGPRSDASARRLGRIFAAQILETLERVIIKERAYLRTSQVLVDLPVRPDWIRLMEVEQEHMQQEFAAGWVLSPPIAQIVKEKIIHTEVQVLYLADLTIVAFPGEVFVETSLTLKAAFPERPLLVIEQANDSIGYIPTLQAFKEGGYETGQHFAARVPPEAEASLFEAARQAIELTGSSQ